MSKRLKIWDWSRVRAFIFILFSGLIGLLGPGIAISLNQIPRPGNLAEAEKMMRVTLSERALPEGADPVLLEKMLLMGQVIMFYDHPKEIPWMSVAGILIRAPMEKVYQVIMDHPRYPEYVPMTDGIDDHKLFENVYQEDLHLKVKLAFINYRMDYGLYSYRQPPHRLDWTLAWGEFDRCVGFWELIPSADQKSTMAFYSIYSEPSSRFLKMIYSREPTLEMMTNVSTATMIVQAMKAEAEKRQGLKPVPAKPLDWPGMEKVLTSDPKTLALFLERGKLLLLVPGPTVYLVAGTLLNSGIQDAFRKITDFKNYPQFMPGVKGVKYLGAGKNGETYRWDLEFDLAGFKFSQSPQWQYRFSPPGLVSWQIDRPCCGPAPGFWKLIPLENKTIVFNGTTTDLRSIGRIPKYALSVEPTLEYASLASQGVLVLNSIKDKIEKK